MQPTTVVKLTFTASDKDTLKDNRKTTKNSKAMPYPTADLTIKGLERALLIMDPNKSPGANGIYGHMFANDFDCQ